MASQRLPKEHIEALEKILGVKLPAEGFTLEIRPISPEDEVDDQALDGVVGGAGGGAGGNRTASATSSAAHVKPTAPATQAQAVNVNKWLAKI